MAAVTAVFGGAALLQAGGGRERAAIELADWGFVAGTAWLAQASCCRGASASGAYLQKQLPPRSWTSPSELSAASGPGSRPRPCSPQNLMAFMLAWRLLQPLANGSVGAYRAIGPVLVLLGIALVLGIVGLRMHRALGAELDDLRERRRRYED